MDRQTVFGVFLRAMPRSETRDTGDVPHIYSAGIRGKSEPLVSSGQFTAYISFKAWAQGNLLKTPATGVRAPAQPDAQLMTEDPCPRQGIPRRMTPKTSALSADVSDNIISLWPAIPRRRADN
jgi:hypothetical protein